MAREGWRALAPRLALADTVAGIGPANLKVSALEMSWYMRNQLLRDSDWAGMAQEIRLPLVDLGLFRAMLPGLAAARPPDKHDMALSARPLLPATILEKPKTGFFVPVAEWLGGGSLRGWAASVHRAFAPDGHIHHPVQAVLDSPMTAD